MSINSLQCPKCFGHYKTKQTLGRHIRKCGSKNVECPECGKILAKNMLDRHKGTKACKDFNVKNPVSWKICQYCKREAKTIVSNSQHEIRCKLNPNKIKVSGHSNGGNKKGHISWNYGLTKDTDSRVAEISNKLKGRCTNLGYKHTQETKDKLSEIRINYIKNNPDKVPYKLNHYSKGRSYPEQYWKDVLDTYQLDYSEQVRVGLYRLDFAFLSQKIDLEIDGETHYQLQSVIDKDIRRTKNLEDLGWKVIRIRWSEYQKLTQEEKSKYVQNIIEMVSLPRLELGTY